mmetsp:Transcript_62645/g.125509  ORF Transcript_62645/g.125509 Transcript_62645/m.125509 type:complete len:255 (+) Transcript_62645:19-783(+)
MAQGRPQESGRGQSGVVPSGTAPEQEAQLLQAGGVEWVVPRGCLDDHTARSLLDALECRVGKGAGEGCALKQRRQTKATDPATSFHKPGDMAPTVGSRRGSGTFFILTAHGSQHRRKPRRRWSSSFSSSTTVATRHPLQDLGRNPPHVHRVYFDLSVLSLSRRSYCRGAVAIVAVVVGSGRRPSSILPLAFMTKRFLILTPSRLRAVLVRRCLVSVQGQESFHARTHFFCAPQPSTLLLLFTRVVGFTLGWCHR